MRSLREGVMSAATQVKVLSPVIINVKEVDSFHVLEDNMIYFVKVRDRLLFRGLRPRYDMARQLQELGRPCKFCLLMKGRTCRLRQKHTFSNQEQ